MSTKQAEFDFNHAAAYRPTVTIEQPAHNGTDTSQAAARAIRPQAGRLRQLVYEFISRQGARGATNEEVQQALGLGPQTVTPRANELWHLDLICDSGLRRPTVSGRRAKVWQRNLKLVDNTTTK